MKKRNLMTGFCFAAAVCLCLQLAGVPVMASEQDTLENGEQSLKIGSVQAVDKNFTNPEPMDEDDPHTGWEMGYFTVSGYDSYTESDGTPVFLTDDSGFAVLNFTLLQDIDCLAGDSDLSVADAGQSSDEQSGISRQNFGRGTLIVQYSDGDGNVLEPEVNADFLEAAAQNETEQVLTCQEGDYTITLDYRLVDQSAYFGIFYFGPSYTDYQIRFHFSVRSGLCDVNLEDLGTGETLEDRASTSTGFFLCADTSSYLQIQYTRQRLIGSPDGWTLEEVGSGTARRQQEFTEEGIYTLTMQNVYTGETRYKTIYVGTDEASSEFTASGSTVENFRKETDNSDAFTEKGAAAMAAVFAGIGAVCMVISMREKNMDG